MKRAALIRELRTLAKAKGLGITVDKGRGKGSHYKVTIGDKWTIIQSGELSPLLATKIKKALGLD